MSVLDLSFFSSEAHAYSWVEAQVWPDGRVCPHCGVLGQSSKMQGKSTRMGVYKCYACRKPFTVKVGTIFESSHVPLHKWLQAMFLMCSSKKGISSNQLHRILGVTLKTAWFMSHRIREAMDDKGSSGPMGGEGKILEIDETLWGHGNYHFTNERGWVKEHGTGGKARVMTLVERGGRARSIKMDNMTALNVEKVILENADTKSRLMTDEARFYPRAGKHFVSHERVHHKDGEYARDDVTTNTVESFFSVFKRGMRGTYQHCAERHLHRYANEFSFRHSNRKALEIDDVQRTKNALRGIVGKRLTYRTTSGEAD